MELFRKLLEAKTPIIRGTISDLVFYEEILHDLLFPVVGDSYHIVPYTPPGFGVLSLKEFTEKVPCIKSDPQVIICSEVSLKTSPRFFYNRLSNVEKTLVLLNMKDTETRFNQFMDVGELMPTPELLSKVLSKYIPPIYKLESTQALAGLSLSRSIEIVRSVIAENKEPTLTNIHHKRAQFTRTSRGVSLVNPEVPHYMVMPGVQRWVFENRKFFLSDGFDYRLSPRGLLFDGAAGTGKTMAAKYIAREFCVPLYRLDMGAMMGKWVGESENNLAFALAQIENSQPCVALLDEVEKIFTHDESGVSTRMLGYLLWWLQEHSSKVLVLMTTNNIEGLPKELYRPGRIDEVIEFPLLDPFRVPDQHLSAKFFMQVVKSVTEGIEDERVKAITYPGPKTHPHSFAELAQEAIDKVKEVLSAPVKAI